MHFFQQPNCAQKKKKKNELRIIETPRNEKYMCVLFLSRLCPKTAHKLVFIQIAFFFIFLSVFFVEFSHHLCRVHSKRGHFLKLSKDRRTGFSENNPEKQTMTGNFSWWKVEDVNNGSGCEKKKIK